MDAHRRPSTSEADPHEPLAVLRDDQGPRVAIIGAGVAGATAARALRDGGIHVEVFDKGRGPGGRASTRREAGWAFDHGAQYFTARDPHFTALVETWASAGVARRWDARALLVRDGAAHPDTRAKWVGVPGMSAIVAALLGDVPVAWSTRVVALDRRSDGWTLVFEDGREAGGFDALVVALPAPQASALLADAAPTLSRAAGAVELLPCWTVMLGFDAPLALPFDAAKIDGPGPLAWIARDTSKPGRRAEGDAWVLQASPAWSRTHLEEEPEVIIRALLAAFVAEAGASCTVPTPVLARAHRWRYAKTDVEVGEPILHDRARGIVLAGDWLLGARLEAAYLSGRAAAERVVSELALRVAAKV